MTQKKMTYKEAFSKLENILLRLENNELDVDELSVNVKEASELIKFCKSKLFETEAEVEKIINELDSEK
ncbi:MAG: exodeoxyribonuclease VII small subunit [Bacteroidales bacterium]|nr:exodeoxyribonuclease VII small subunit [Bacteroidales bacterium]